MHIFLSFAVAQLPLLAQAFFLHPHYQSTPKALLIRLALVPLGVSLLVSFGLRWRSECPGWMSASANKNFGQLLIVLALRCIIWGTTSRQYYQLSPSGSPKQAPKTFYNCLWFACELLYNFRGIGWSFGVPVKPQNQDNGEFLRATVRRLLINTTVFLALLELMAVLKKWAYFEMFPFCYLKAVLAMPLFWVVIDNIGCLPRFMAVIFNRNKDEYPFFIDSVHKSFNLTIFWSRWWHSCLRHTLIEAGTRPAYTIVAFIEKNYLNRKSNEMAKAVGVLSAFFLSGLVHEFGLWFATHLDWSFRTTTFFLSQGVAILLEGLFTRFTGRRVGGFPAWAFALIWGLFWLQPMVDVCIEHGIIDLDKIPTVSLYLRSYLE